MQTIHDTKLKWKLSPKEKVEIVQLYLNGRVKVGRKNKTQPITVSTICRIYNIDHSTVYYHLKRAQVFEAGKPRELRTVQQIITVTPVMLVRKPKQLLPREDDDGSPICEGFNYAEYLRREKEKKFRRFGLIK